jgi:site-specific recombinase XerD
MSAKPTHKLVRDFLASHRLDWSDHHREVGVGVLNRWCRWLAAHDVELVDVSKADCVEYIAERREAVAVSTATKDYQFLRWLYAWLDDEGELPGRDPMRGVKGLGTPPHDPTRTPHITAETYETLMASFDKRLTLDCRNAAIVSLLYRSGARGIEVCRADLERLDVDRQTLQVIGKNGQWGTLHLAAETCRLLERYLRRRGDDRSPALFVGTTGTKSADGRLTQRAIAEMLDRRARKLGLHLPVHAFRRAMAIDAKRRGLNDTTVQHIGRWADPRMVARYQRNAQAELAAAEFHAADPTARQTSKRRPLRSVG